MFGLFGNKKTAHVATVNAEGLEVTVQPGDNLLKAALDKGIAWPHNCRVGSCGTCRCRLVEGKIKPLNDFSYVLNKEELDAGMILACQTSLRSDVRIEVALEKAPDGLAQAKKVKGKIASTNMLTHDIVEVSIRLDEPMPTYLAGQYADIKVGGVVDAPRSYSFADAPGSGPINKVKFFIRRIPGGQFTDWLHAEKRDGARVELEGPHGSFWLRDSSDPMICVAGGSGLAPIKALLEQLAEKGFDRKVKFLFGARTEKDLYCLDQMRKIEASSSGHFEFIPVLSAEPDESAWSGARGLVADFISKCEIDVPKAHGYLCGPPPMVDAAIKHLSEAGVPIDKIYYDKFLDASTMPGGR